MWSAPKEQRGCKQVCVFDIERFATEDGPGIRTVAFFKGCDMRCPWCHNAEGLVPRIELLFEPERCIGCGECARVCPTQAHKMVDGVHVLDREVCNMCLHCADGCFSGALSASGRIISIEKLSEELLRDAEYYEKSGGGVTLSGGEVMCQFEAAFEILKMLHERGIHTAIETNLNARWELYEQILPYLDLIMFDIKCADDALHKRYTGISNERILKNAARLAQCDIEKIARTPVVAGVNDAPEEIAAIAAGLKRMKRILYYELLRYHPLGRKKYALLGFNESPPAFEAPDSARMRELATVAALHSGKEVRVDGKAAPTGG